MSSSWTIASNVNPLKAALPAVLRESVPLERSLHSFWQDEQDDQDKNPVHPVDPVKYNAFGLDAGGGTGSEAGSVLKHKGPTWTVAVVRNLEQMGLVQYLPDHQRD